MGDNSLVITAIADSDCEGFVASTLFHQGWDVVFRALDVKTLISHLEKVKYENPIVILSRDFQGLTDDHLIRIHTFSHRIILIEKGEKIEDSHQLLSRVRGNMRAPLFRNSAKKSHRARIYAIAGAAPNVGATTFSTNLAMELSNLDKKTLLIDADPIWPNIANLLDLRNIRSEAREIAENLYALEVTEENVDISLNHLIYSIDEYDCIIFDLGTLGNLEKITSDRRWIAKSFMWCMDYSDEVIIITTSDLMAVSSLRKVVKHLPEISLNGKVNFLLNQRSSGKRGENEEATFLTIVTPLKPHLLFLLPEDRRNANAARSERCTLLEKNEKGALRKQIAEIAREI